jgi:hypothetical protein
VLSEIFVPKSEGVTGGWRKLHDDGLNEEHSLLILLEYQIEKSELWGEEHAVCMERREKLIGFGGEA